MPRFVLGLVLLVGPAVAAAAEPQPTTVALPVPAKLPKQARALEHRLLPDPLDLTHGNAAPMWLRAGTSARTSTRKWTDAEYKWSSRDEMPLDKLPRKEVRELLAQFGTALRLAHQAARLDRCDWDLPPLTLQGLNDLPFDDIQGFRVLAQLLSVEFRLRLAEGELGEALRAVQTGLALARDVGKRPTIIDNLVAIALEAIMLGRVEEYLAAPGAPNLYWPLTVLPDPLVDIRRALEHEMGIFHRSFPELRKLGQAKLTEAQARAMTEEFYRSLAQVADQIGSRGKPSDEEVRQRVAAVIAKLHAEAKKALLASGRKAAVVDAMPAAQAVTLYLMERFDREADEMQKWFNLPPWQARPGLEQQAKRLKEARRMDLSDALFGQFDPAMVKVLEAGSRMQRHTAALRVVEAVRLYAAAHEGKLPATLADVQEAPLPLNPDTGKSFDAYWTVTGGKGVLDVPPPSGQHPAMGRRYELTPVK